MKNILLILLGLVASMLFCNFIQVEPVVAEVTNFIHSNAETAVTASILGAYVPRITPEQIKELAVKHGRLKTITVVVEKHVYDIDNISLKDRQFLEANGVDLLIVQNTELTIEDRLYELNKMHKVNEGKDKQDCVELPKLTGKIIEEGEYYQFLVKRPDKSLMNMLMPLAQNKNKFDEFADKAVKNLVVGGDMDKIEDGIVYMGIVSQLKGTFAPAGSFLKNA